MLSYVPPSYLQFFLVVMVALACVMTAYGLPGPVAFAGPHPEAYPDPSADPHWHWGGWGHHHHHHHGFHWG